jgi:hypothetical protein
MGVIGYAAIVLAVTRRAVWPLASPLASWQSKSVAVGRLVERLSIVRWMGLGLTITTNTHNGFAVDLVSAGTERKKWNLPFWNVSENRTKIDLDLLVH